MSQGTLEFTSYDLFELTRVNRALAQLARPASTDLYSGRAGSRRKHLIEDLWNRKRQLLRRAKGVAERTPVPPVA